MFRNFADDSDCSLSTSTALLVSSLASCVYYHVTQALSYLNMLLKLALGFYFVGYKIITGAPLKNLYALTAMIFNRARDCRNTNYLPDVISFQSCMHSQYLWLKHRCECTIE